jgi:hypothetical protein
MDITLRHEKIPLGIVGDAPAGNEQQVLIVNCGQPEIGRPAYFGHFYNKKNNT